MARTTWRGRKGSVSGHWLRVNIVWSLVAAALWGTALAALVSYWRFPEYALNSHFQAFAIQGIIPVAYTLFAVALGIAIGSVLRHASCPSLAVTLAVLVAFRAVIGVYLRPHLMAPHHETVLTRRSGQHPFRRLDPLDQLRERPRPRPRERVSHQRNPRRLPRASS